MRQPILYIVFLIAMLHGNLLFSQNQHLFKVNTETTKTLDQLYYANQSDARIEMDSLFDLTEKFDLNLFSTEDSLAYYFCRAGYLYGTQKIDIALEELFRGLAIAERIKNGVFIAGLYHQISNAHYFLRDYEATLGFIEKAINTSGALPQTIATELQNKAAILYEYYVASDDESRKDSLSIIIDKSYAACISILQEIKNYKHLAATYSVIIPWHAVRGQYDSAYYITKLALELAHKYNLISRKAFIRINIGATLMMEGRYIEALDTLQLTIDYYKKTGNKIEQVHSIRVKANVYEKMGDYKSAFLLYREAFEIQRASFNTQLFKSVANYKVRYQTNKKELENNILKTENDAKKQKINSMVLWGVALLAIFISILFFYRNKLKKSQLETQKQQLAFKDTLLKSNLESEERERKRIARELHDGVGQQISGIKLGLENIGEEQKVNSQKVAELKEMVSVVLNSVRDISHQMMPLALQRFGLILAIESLCEFMNTNSKIKFTFENYNIKKLNILETTEVHIYRIIQELIKNITKHSKATEASIQIFKQEKNLIITVSDNGIGMPVVNKNLGIGLLNIHSRTSAIDGEVNFDNIDGETVVTLKLPIA